MSIHYRVGESYGRGVPISAMVGSSGVHALVFSRITVVYHAYLGHDLSVNGACIYDKCIQFCGVAGGDNNMVHYCGVLFNIFWRRCMGHAMGECANPPSLVLAVTNGLAVNGGA